jgi:hypothetical protein
MKDSNTDEPRLTLDQARDRVLAAAAARWPAVSFRLWERATLVRKFGWVFTLVLFDGTADSAFPRLALVDKTSGQVIATHRSYTPEQFAAVFERLQARSHGNWCLTMHAHLEGVRFDITAEARAAGLEQLAGALEHR